MIRGLRQLLSAPPDVTGRNIRYLYLEIAFASALGAIVLNFNSAFAIRLGATKEMIALMTSIPALVAAVFSIPSARFLEGRQNRHLWLSLTLLFTRAAYIVVALLPLIFADRMSAAWAMIVWVIVLNLPTIFFTNGWQALLGDIIPTSRRAFVLSRRSILLSTGLVIVSALSGMWLDRFVDEFPLNYQLLYLFGFLITALSNYYVAKLSVPKSPQLPTRRNLRVQEARMLPAEKKVGVSPPMRRLLMNMGVYHIGLTLAAALFNVYYINQLKATDGWLGLNSAAGNAGVVVGYFVWERLLRKRSYEWGIRTATMFTFLFPVGIALFPNFLIISALNFVVNVMHSGVELSNFNLMLKLSDPAHRAVAMSWYNMVININLFAAPLVGVWLAGFPAIDIPGVLIIAGGFRILGSVLFRLNPVREPQEAVS